MWPALSHPWPPDVSRRGDRTFAMGLSALLRSPSMALLGALLLLKEKERESKEV